MAINVDIMGRAVYEYRNKKTGKCFSMPYRYYFPSSYNENDDKKYPMLFFLHGHGECGTDNELQIRVLHKENRLIDMTIERDDCIIVAPQCPCNTELEWVPVNHKWNTGSRALTEEPTVGMAVAMELLDKFLACGKVDLSRVYAAGISMGGYGTWELITRRPEVFAAAVPVCGSGIPDMADKLVNMGIWAFHGEADGTVPSQGTRDMEAAIKAAGGTKMKATYFPGVGHDSWIPAYKTEGLMNWLFSQKK